jgi:hypothetical protein
MAEGVDRTAGTLENLRADLADVLHRLTANALASEAVAQRILQGQDRLAAGLRQDMERMRESLSAQLREFHRCLDDPAAEFPRFYSLNPVPEPRVPLLGMKIPLATRRWRLCLHCEKTGYPAALVRSDGQGEFIIPESAEFLRKLAPYARQVSKVLVALGPLTALLTAANPVITVAPAAVLALAQWAKEYQSPTGALAGLLKEEAAAGQTGLSATGDKPVLAEQEGLLWLHNFLRAQPERKAKLGLLAKTDGQGRRWWVLPEVEV